MIVRNAAVSESGPYAPFDYNTLRSRIRSIKLHIGKDNCLRQMSQQSICAKIIQTTIADIDRMRGANAAEKMYYRNAFEFLQGYIASGMINEANSIIMEMIKKVDVGQAVLCKRIAKGQWTDDAIGLIGMLPVDIIADIKARVVNLVTGSWVAA